MTFKPEGLYPLGNFEISQGSHNDTDFYVEFKKDQYMLASFHYSTYDMNELLVSTRKSKTCIRRDGSPIWEALEGNVYTTKYFVIDTLAETIWFTTETRPFEINIDKEVMISRESYDKLEKKYRAACLALLDRAKRFIDKKGLSKINSPACLAEAWMKEASINLESSNPSYTIKYEDYSYDNIAEQEGFRFLPMGPIGIIEGRF